MQPFEVPAAAQLEDPQKSLVARAERVSHELHDAVRHRELGEALGVVVGVLADQEHGRLETQ